METFRKIQNRMPKKFSMPGEIIDINWPPHISIISSLFSKEYYAVSHVNYLIYFSKKYVALYKSLSPKLWAQPLSAPNILFTEKGYEGIFVYHTITFQTLTCTERPIWSHIGRAIPSSLLCTKVRSINAGYSAALDDQATCQLSKWQVQTSHPKMDKYSRLIRDLWLMAYGWSMQLYCVTLPLLSFWISRCMN